MLEAADAGRRILQLPGLFLGERDQFLHRMDRQLGLTTSTFGPDRQNTDRRERLDRVVGQFVEPGIDRVGERDDADRVAVMRRVADNFGTDDAAGAGRGCRR